MCICRQAVIRHSQLCWRDDNRFLPLSRNDIFFFFSSIGDTQHSSSFSPEVPPYGVRPQDISVFMYSQTLGWGGRKEEEAWAYSRNNCRTGWLLAAYVRLDVGAPKSDSLFLLLLRSLSLLCYKLTRLFALFFTQNWKPPLRVQPGQTDSNL